MTSIGDREDIPDLDSAPYYDTQAGEEQVQDAQCAKTLSHTVTDV